MQAQPVKSATATVHTQESQAAITPETALQLLKEGNQRFINNTPLHRDWLAQMKKSATAQYPYATILSCIDSRAPAELIFDQGIGDIFSIRLAGNILPAEALGSIELTTKFLGSRLIVVLGHTNCGAIRFAIDNKDQIGSIPSVVDKILPAVNEVAKEIPQEAHNGEDTKFAEAVTAENVKLQMARMREQSPIVDQFIKEGKVKIVGAIFHLATGKVEFLND